MFPSCYFTHLEQHFTKRTSSLQPLLQHSIGASKGGGQRGPDLPAEIWSGGSEGPCPCKVSLGSFDKTSLVFVLYCVMDTAENMFNPSGDLLIPSFPLKIPAQKLLLVSMVQMGQLNIFVMCFPLLCSLILRMPMRDYTMFLLRNTILIVATALIATVLMLNLLNK